MRAALITDIAAPPSLADRPDPTAADGEELLHVEAVALNPVDLAIASGRFHLGHPPLPFVPGVEAVGRLVDGRLV